MNKEQYLEKFETKAAKQFAKKAADLADLKRQLVELRAYLKSETENIVHLTSTIAEKKKSIGALVSDGESCDDFKKQRADFKDSLAALTGGLIISRELVATLEKSIPLKQRAVETAADRLSVQLNNFVAAQRHVADDELKKRVLEIENERSAFLDAFDVIYEQFGIAFIKHDPSVFPGGLTKIRLADLKKNCGITEVVIYG